MILLSTYTFIDVFDTVLCSVFLSLTYVHLCRSLWWALSISKIKDCVTLPSCLQFCHKCIVHFLEILGLNWLAVSPHPPHRPVAWAIWIGLLFVYIGLRGRTSLAYVGLCMYSCMPVYVYVCLHVWMHACMHASVCGCLLLLLLRIRHFLLLVVAIEVVSVAFLTSVRYPPNWAGLFFRCRAYAIM